HVPAAALAPLAEGRRVLAVGAQVVGALGDLDVLGLPQGEGVDRPCRPFPARGAVAVAHHGRLARAGDFHGSTGTFGRMRLALAHRIFSLRGMPAASGERGSRLPGTITKAWWKQRILRLEAGG